MKPAILASAITAIAIILSGCAPAAIQGKEPNATTRFSSTPDEIADCVINTVINERFYAPVRSVRDGLLRVSSVQGGVALNWELTLRPDGIAEIRGFPTVWGWAHGEDVIPIVESCDLQIIEQKGS